MNIETKTENKPDEMRLKEKADIIDLQLMGLPLSNKGTTTIVAVIILFILLQIKLEGTFWAEGTLGFLAFISFIILRIWFLKNEYPKDLGAIEITASTLKLPKIMNGKIDWLVVEKDALAKIIVYRTFSKGGGERFTSVSFILKNRLIIISLNAFTTDLDALIRCLKKKGYQYLKAPSVYETRIKTVILLITSSIVLYIAYRIFH